MSNKEPNAVKKFINCIKGLYNDFIEFWSWPDIAEETFYHGENSLTGHFEPDNTLQAIVNRDIDGYANDFLPPSIGWYWARPICMNSSSDPTVDLRWWNGFCWSYPVECTENEVFAGEWANRPGMFTNEEIVWKPVQYEIVPK